MTSYQEYLRHAVNQHGARFDASELAPQFQQYFRTGQRITVAFVSAMTGEVYEVRRGTVGVTTGWRPCFLLMHNSRSLGSSYTLSAKDRIVTMDEWRKFRQQQLVAQ